MAPQGPAALQVQKYKLKISQSNNRYQGASGARDIEIKISRCADPPLAKTNLLLLIKIKNLSTSISNLYVFSENRILILSICMAIGMLLVFVAVDITCYFSAKRGILNRIINRQIPEGAQQIGNSESSENSSTDDEKETEKCLSNM